jgi:hypothetical protein
MVVGVEIEFAEEPTENEIQSMKMAAEKLAKRPLRIEIQESDDLPKRVTVVFRMKNAPQYTVMDLIAHKFKYALSGYDYIDIVIWFRQEKAYDLENTGRS